jgi:hypothetical protein
LVNDASPSPLTVAISSRALFDFEAENRVFEEGDDRAYMQLQLQRLEQPAAPGVAFLLVQKLLRFNDTRAQRVEVVIQSRNDPVSGMRVFRSAAHCGLPIQGGVPAWGQKRSGPAWRALPMAIRRRRSAWCSAFSYWELPWGRWRANACANETMSAPYAP